MKPTFSRALAGLVLCFLPAACDTPTWPTPNRSEPSPALVVEGALSGTYTLTIAASSRCRSELPDDLRTRTYTATIYHAAADDSLMVTLRGPSSWSFFSGQGDSFTGTLGEPTEVKFQLDLIEEWLEAGFLSVSGRMTTTIVEENLSGSLDGVMEALVSNEDGRGNRRLTCAAPDHDVVFSRRPR